MSSSGRSAYPQFDALNYGAAGNLVNDDTDAIQAACNAANAKATLNGIVDVVLRAGYGFSFGQLALPSNVRLWAYGATCEPVLSEISAGWIVPAAGFSRCEVRGGTWQGSGTETAANNNFLFYDGSPAAGHGQDLRLQDMMVNNWGCPTVFYMRDASRAKILDNDFVTIGANGGTSNVVNFPVNNANPGQKIIVRGNTFDGFATPAIAYVNASGAAGVVRMVVANNITIGAAVATDAHGFDLETNEAVGQFIVHHNIFDNSLSTNVNASGMTLSVSGGTGITQCVLSHNVLLGKYGFYASAQQTSDDIAAVNNRITATTLPFHANCANWQKSGNQYSPGPRVGQSVLVAGTVTVATPEVIAADSIHLDRVVAGGALGHLSVGTIVSGTSFVINSSSATDTSTIYWEIDH